MAVALALFSALFYGLADFVGGFVSRRTSSWPVAVVGQLSSAVCTAVLASTASGDPRGADFAWAVLGGIGSGTGTGFLYRGFASGRMSVVAPVSAVGTAVLPVLVGVLVGERPASLAWVGILVAFPAIWLVSSVPADDLAGLDDRPGRASLAEGVWDGVLAGVGFGLLFVALGQIPDGAGLWPLATAQSVSVPAVVVLALVIGEAWLPRDRRVGWALVTGPVGTGATLCFLLAAQRGFLSVAGVLASLYPASTVLLAALVLRERIHRAQAAGLALCAVAVSLVVLG